MEEVVNIAKYAGPPGAVLLMFFAWWMKIVAPQLQEARQDRLAAENRNTVDNQVLLQVAATLKETASINLRITERLERKAGT